MGKEGEGRSGEGSGGDIKWEMMRSYRRWRIGGEGRLAKRRI
jgi:hypothetical protein